RLQQSGGADAVRAGAILNERADAALGVNRVRDHRQNYDEQNSNDFCERTENEPGVHVDLSGRAGVWLPPIRCRLLSARAAVPAIHRYSRVAGRDRRPSLGLIPPTAEWLRS